MSSSPATHDSEWTVEDIEACKRAGWYLPARSQGITGYYPSEAMRAFRDGLRAGKAIPSANVTPSTTAASSESERQDIFRQIADQFPAQVPPDDYQFEFIFGVKLDYRDWRIVLKALQSATASPDEGYPGIAHDLETMRAALAEFVRIDEEDSVGLQCGSGSDLVLALDDARAALKIRRADSRKELTQAEKDWRGDL